MMKKVAFLWAALVILAFQVGPLTHARADVAGRLTLVEGRVDILKGGKLPATPVNVDDRVQPGDVLRTKSLSKAQITFIDNSTLTIAPESRVAIEEYLFDPAQKKRNAVVQLFRGLAHVVVNQVFKVEKPDFVVKTHTAIMGVRGTDFGIRLHPNSSTIMNFKGVLQVGNIFPEVGQLSRRAFKIAFSFGSGASHNTVLLRDMQATSVGQNLPPTLPFTITPQDRQAFMGQMASGLTSIKSGGGSASGSQSGGGGSPSSGGAGSSGSSSSGGGSGSQATFISTSETTGTGGTATMPTGALSSTTPVSVNAPGGGGQTTLAALTTVTVPPTVTPQQNPIQSPAAPVSPTAPIAIPVFNILTSWGPLATDLDLHLTGPQGSSTFHVYYPTANKGSLTTQPYAMLHKDDTGTSGSEVITVQQFNQGGLYQASVFNYGNQSTTSTNLSTTSAVTLKVINGGTVVPLGNGNTVNGGTVVTTVTPPANLQGNTWKAVSINPANGQVTTVNQITNTNNGH